MNCRNHYRGFTLVELMITVAIIGILSAIATPMYNDYIRTSQVAAAKHNAVTLAGFEETYFYEHDTYLAGTYTPGGANTLTSLGWQPTGDDVFQYLVQAAACGDIKKCFKITVALNSDTTISAKVKGGKNP